MTTSQSKCDKKLVEEWKEKDPFLLDIEGFEKFVQNRTDAKELLRLTRLGHPNQHGEPYSRLDVMKMIEERGMQILDDLGWPSDMDSHYSNIHGYTVSTLKQILYQFYDPVNRPDEKIESQLFWVLEDWEPTTQTETVYPALTDKDEIYAIQCAVSHVADNYIPRMAKSIYNQYGKKEAIKFLRQQLSCFGVLCSPRPNVEGSSKGVTVAYDKDMERRRISFTRILNYILAEM